MGCDSPLKGWKDRETGGITFRRENSFGEKMEVACGSCLGCRLDYRRMWAMRITHEASLYESRHGNSFITLTYRDKYLCTDEELKEGYHVPDDWSLHKSHYQKFLKRLRKAFPRKKGDEIRYYLAGEYGRKCQHGIDVTIRPGCPICNVGRPHYHAILFNCTFDDLEPYQSDGGVIRYTSPKLEKIWKYGFVDVGDCTFNSASYVAGYCIKKMRGINGDDWYMHYDLDGVVTYITPEFVAMSRGNAAYKGQRCGIGAGFYEKYKKEIYHPEGVPVPGTGMVRGVPRYYDDILRDENPIEYEEMKRIRREFMRNNKDEYTDERLLDKHRCKKARLEMKGGGIL